MALRIGIVWVPIILVTGLVEYSVGSPDPSAPEISPLARVQVVIGIISIIAVCSIAVSWHRFILRDESAAGLRIDGDVFRYAGNTLLIMLAMLVPGLIFLTILMLAPGPGDHHCSRRRRDACLDQASRSGDWQQGFQLPRCMGRQRGQFLALRWRLPAECSNTARNSSGSHHHRGGTRADQRGVVAVVSARGRGCAATVLCDLQRIDFHFALWFLRRAARFLTCLIEVKG